MLLYTPALTWTGFTGAKINIFFEITNIFQKKLHLGAKKVISGEKEEHKSSLRPWSWGTCWCRGKKEHKSYLKSEGKSFGELVLGDKKEHKSYLKSEIKSLGELVLGR
jgi:hypothetical protein